MDAGIVLVLVIAISAFVWSMWLYAKRQGPDPANRSPGRADETID
jgi:hypothetical protein